MKKLNGILFMVFIHFFFQGIAQDESTTISSLSALASFNLINNKSGWSNTTPTIFYGWGKLLPFRKSSKLNLKLTVGPYVGSQIQIKDSNSYLPAIMLPNNVGAIFNTDLTWDDSTGSKLKITLSPLSFGLKSITGFSDSSLSLVQHNIRLALAIQYDKSILISGQLTRAWHNSTSQSEENYSKIFPHANTAVTYLNLTAQTRIVSDLTKSTTSTNPLYLFISFYDFVGNKHLKPFPNTRFFSIGIRSSLDFTSGTDPGHLGIL